MAEASNTALLTLGFLAPLGKQFVDQRHAGVQILPRTALCPLNAAFHRRDLQFVVLEAQDDLVSRLDPKSVAECCRNDYAPVFIDTYPGLRRHDISLAI